MNANSATILDLDLGSNRPSKPGPARRFGRILLRILWPVVKVILLLALPFFILVRGSVYAYSELGWGTWGSTAAGVVATLLVVLAYAMWAWRRLTGRSLPRLLRRGVLAVGIASTAYGLLYLSASNAKAPELRQEFSSLHPLLRLGASTMMLADREAVLTGVGRTVEDYLKMGLPVNESSLHFKLADRYVHALDLRTTGRPEWRNRLTYGYFRAMGFRTLRHVGTGDHIHVSLPLAD